MQLEFGEFYERKKDLESALSVFRKALAKATNLDLQFEALLRLGRVQSRLGMFSAAVNILERCVQLRPASALAKLYLGLAFQRRQDLPKALDCYWEALDLDNVIAVDAYYYSALILLDIAKGGDGTMSSSSSRKDFNLAEMTAEKRSEALAAAVDSLYYCLRVEPRHAEATNLLDQLPDWIKAARPFPALSETEVDVLMTEYFDDPDCDFQLDFEIPDDPSLFFVSSSGVPELSELSELSSSAE